MRLLETDQFNLKLQIKNEPSKRIIENFSNGLTLGNSILHEIDDIIKKENFQI